MRSICWRAERARPRQWLVIIWDARFFVDGPPHAMPTKFFHHTELTSTDFPLDRPSDFIDTIARTSGFGGMMESTLSAPHQSIRRGRDTDSLRRPSQVVRRRPRPLGLPLPVRLSATAADHRVL